MVGAIVGGAAALGSAALAASSSGAKGSSSSSSQPWSYQQPYLAEGFQQALNVQNDRLASGPYTGSLYSPINGVQGNAMWQAANWGTGEGQGLASGTAQTANVLQGGAPSYMANAQGLAGRSVDANPLYTGTLSNIAQSGGGQLVNGGLSSALNQSAISGAQALQGYQSTLGQAAQTGLQDNTGRTLGDAAQYVNSSPVNAQIAANNANIERVLNEQTVPGINRAASMGGNLNSSRAGMAEAMANRDAAQLEAQNAATLQGNAFNTGVNASSQQLIGGLNAATAAAGTGSSTANGTALGAGSLEQSGNEFNTGAQLNAANSGLTSALGYAGLNNQTQLAANQQIGSGVNMGLNGALGASQLAAQNYALGSGAGGAMQQDQLNQLQNAYQMWNTQNQYAQGVLNNYWNVAGGGNFGGSTSATTTQPYSPTSSAVGAGLSTAGLFAKGGPLNGLFSGNNVASQGASGTSADGTYYSVGPTDGMDTSKWAATSGAAPASGGGFLSSLFG